MKLLLSVAVLLVALTVMADYASAEESPGVGEHLKKFGHKVKEIASDIGDKTKKAFQGLHDSEGAKKMRNWLSDAGQKLKDVLNIKSK
ncbi:apolipoprotein C-I [Ambystoma mexicanum]|uniref:apolipoprotein C-I n=1 Tax=Ambystoma mexicanum TaxID=8296 RepID=UPI0037E7154B